MGWWLMRWCAARALGRCCWQRRRSGLAEDGARACRSGRTCFGSGRMGFICGMGMSITRRRKRFGRDCEGEEVREGQGQSFKRGVAHAGYVEVLRGVNGAPQDDRLLVNLAADAMGRGAT